MDLQYPLQVIYKTVGKIEISTDIYLPQPRPSENPPRYPVAIDIHGGAFMLGHSSMVSRAQVKDCLDREWIVLAPNHRLCPQVNLLEGPMQDCRDLLRWIHEGNLDIALADRKESSAFRADRERIVAFGTSSGGTLALSLGFEVDRPVAAILDLYGPVNFSAPFWTTKLPHVAAKLPPGLSDDFLRQVYREDPVPTAGGISLEGQTQPSKGPDFSNPRQAFALTQVANGTVLQACYPSEDRDVIDPLKNITGDFPPTFIVHGQEDVLVPVSLSRDLFAALKSHGVECGMVEVPDEGHTFAANMEVASRTWNLQREGFDFLQQVIDRIRR